MHATKERKICRDKKIRGNMEKRMSVEQVTRVGGRKQHARRHVEEES